MQYIQKGEKFFYGLADDDKELQSTQVFAMGGQGNGKTVLMEAYIDRMIRYEGKCFIFDDPKDKLELGFMQFKQDKERLLNMYGLKPIQHKVELFHPLTTLLPNKKIPEMKFFSFPITSIDEEDILFFLESDEDKQNRELLITAVGKLSKDSSFYNLIQYTNAEMRSKAIIKGKRIIPLPDPERFGLLSPKSGSTIKELSKVYSAFERLKRYPIFQPETSIWNIDFKSMFKSDTNVFIFSTRYCPDDKLKKFILFKLMLLLIDAKRKYFPHGKILEGIDEAALYYDAELAKKFFYIRMLISRFCTHLKTAARVNGISSITTNHSMGGLNKKLFSDNIFNRLLVGRTNSKSDREVLKEVYSFSPEHLKRLEDLPKFGTYMGIGFEEIPADQSHMQLLRTIPSNVRHCEEGEEYNDIFAKQFPERMHNYYHISKELIQQEQDEKKKLKSLYNEEKAKHEEKPKVIEKTDTKELKQVKEQLSVAEKEIQQNRNLEIYNAWKNGEKQTELAKKFNVSQAAISKTIKRFQNANLSDSSLPKG